MKHIFFLSLAALAVSGCAAPPASRQSPQEESALTALLAGRVPGTPLSCVSTPALRGNRGYGEAVIVFETTGRDLVYVNRPPHGCPRLTSGRALRVRSTSTQLCRGDLVTIFDPVAGIDYGGCALGDFVPYRR